MATSRTGTAAYKHWRRRVLARGQADGVTSCPICGVQLDYRRGRQPNSAEPDHILAHRWGGRETAENGRVLCRRCNQSRGDGRRTATPEPKRTTTDFAW